MRATQPARPSCATRTLGWLTAALFRRPAPFAGTTYEGLAAENSWEPVILGKQAAGASSAAASGWKSGKSTVGHRIPTPYEKKAIRGAIDKQLKKKKKKAPRAAGFVFRDLHAQPTAPEEEEEEPMEEEYIVGSVNPFAALAVSADEEEMEAVAEAARAKAEAEVAAKAKAEAEVAAKAAAKAEAEAAKAKAAAAKAKKEAADAAAKAKKEAADAKKRAAAAAESAQTAQQKENVGSATPVARRTRAFLSKAMENVVAVVSPMLERSRSAMMETVSAYRAPPPARVREWASVDRPLASHPVGVASSHSHLSRVHGLDTICARHTLAACVRPFDGSGPARTPACKPV